jgi:23S rRNA (cytosine1962-C5)-methyltransferase
VDVGTAEHDFVARGVYDPGAAVAVRVWTRDRGEFLDAGLVARRIREAAAVRERAGLADETDAYRLVHGESDFLPGILVDRWGEHLSVTLQGDAVRRWERTVLDGLAAAVPSAGVYVRDDDESRLVAGEPLTGEFVVREPTGRYLARIDQPGKPGVFTDMRDVRRALAPRLAGRSFLNLFAHTGAFSGCAAAAKASQIVSVDLSRQALDVARRNVETNGKGTPHEIVAADVFETLRGFAQARRNFDVILADPPTFSSSKSSGAFNVKDHYRSLARGAIRVTAPGGLFVASTNFRGTDTEQFLRILHDAAEAERVRLRVLAVHGQAPDHPSLAMVPETRHLRVAFCSVVPPSRDDA